MRPSPEVQPHVKGWSIRLPISERKLLLGLGDLLAVNLAVLIALRIWAFVGQRDYGLSFLLSQSHWFVILSILWLALAAANNFYDLALTARWLRSQKTLLQITFQLLVIYLLIFFFSARDALPRLFILYYAAASYTLIALWRLARPFLIGWIPLRRRALVVGTGWSAQAIIEAIRHSAPDDYEVVGVVADAGTSGIAVSDTLIITRTATLASFVQQGGVDEIILATSEVIDGELFQAIMDCYEQGIPVTPMPILYERLTNMVPVEYVGGHWMIVLPLEGGSPFNPYPFLKRLTDIVFSAAGLTIFVMLLPLIALLIVVDSGGPIFYSQERVGRAGRIFRLAKFRTMVADAEARQGPLWAVANDTRVTRVGLFLRKTRLDELPQCWNILLGEMSLIGPRPERPFFVEHLQKTIPFYRTRLAVQPGLTGWAQVNYRYGSSEEDALVKLKYDLYYIRHRSLLLDALILMRTVARVIKMEGI